MTGQVTVCMAEPALYEILRPRSEAAGRTAASPPRPAEHGRNPHGRHLPRLPGTKHGRTAWRVHHPAGTDHPPPYMPGRRGLYLERHARPQPQRARRLLTWWTGDFTGSWKHIPKDLSHCRLGRQPRPQEPALFCRARAFATLVACYYDADDLNDVHGLAGPGAAKRPTCGASCTRPGKRNIRCSPNSRTWCASDLYVMAGWSWSTMRNRPARAFTFEFQEDTGKTLTVTCAMLVPPAPSVRV